MQVTLTGSRAGRTIWMLYLWPDYEAKLFLLFHLCNLRYLTALCFLLLEGINFLFTYICLYIYILYIMLVIFKYININIYIYFKFSLGSWL